MASSLRLPETRWGAFFGHLLISLGILLVLSLFIWLVMFPGALFTLAGGVEGIKIIAGVDIVLGPLLTLVIYNRAKPLRALTRDLAVIGTIQIAALTAGMFIVHSSRPAAVTYAYDQFHTTKGGEFAGNGTARPDGLNWFTPAWFNIELPSADEDALAMMAELELSGVQARLRTDLYEPMSSNPDTLAQQLRLGLNSPETIKQTCIKRTLSTAFDMEDVCFDPKKFRIYSAPSKQD